mgnify:CR=1 FL=1
MSKNFIIMILLTLFAAAGVVSVSPMVAGMICGALGTFSYYLGKEDTE